MYVYVYMYVYHTYYELMHFEHNCVWQRPREYLTFCGYLLEESPYTSSQELEKK